MKLRRSASVSIVLIIVLFFGAELAIVPLDMPHSNISMPPVNPQPIKLNLENTSNLNNSLQFDYNTLAQSYDRWWAGSVSNFMFPAILATSLEVVIKTPASNPTTDDWYFFGLSCWDNNDSYDQIGFNSWGPPGNRYWSFLVSYTIFVDGQLVILPHNNVMKLALNTRYKFTMNIYSAGRVHYKLYKDVGGSWLIKKTVSRDTGGSRFVISSTYWTGYGWYTDFTNYEEAYLGTPAPSFDIIFEYTKWNTYYFTSWSIWDLHVDDPPGIDVQAYGWPLFRVFIFNP